MPYLAFPIRFYVSGGMTGWPDNNEAAFDEAAAGIRALGHYVETPVEWGRADKEILQGDGFNASDEEYEGFLDRDIARINKDNFDAVAFIRGWQTSGGSGREGRRALVEGLDLYVWDKSLGGLLILQPAAFLANSRIERLRREEVQ